LFEDFLFEVFLFEVFLSKPFAGLLEAMMAGKFESQFKHRDEADVNETARPACR